MPLTQGVLMLGGPLDGKRIALEYPLTQIEVPLDEGRRVVTRLSEHDTPVKARFVERTVTYHRVLFDLPSSGFTSEVCCAYVFGPLLKPDFSVLRYIFDNYGKMPNGEN